VSLIRPPVESCISVEPLNFMSAKPSRYFGIDVLRGGAALLILFRHMPLPEEIGALADAARFLSAVGWVGVDLFFVISGFLISQILFREINQSGRINLPRFWFRRGCKIWPSYFVFYGIGMASVAVVDPNITALDLGKYWPNLLFIQNYFPDTMRWRHSWSLAVEEQFYIALPILLTGWLILRAKGRSTTGDCFVPGLLMLCAIVLCGRSAVALGGADWEKIYYPTHLRIDALAWGVLLGYLTQYRAAWLGTQLPKLKYAVIISVVPFVLALYQNSIETSPAIFWSVGFSVLSIWFLWAVALAVVPPDAVASSGRPWYHWLIRPLAWLGIYSYTIYLAHAIVFKLPGMTEFRGWFYRMVNIGSWSDSVLFIGLSIILGWLGARLLEQPILRWRDINYPASKP